jgi:Putative restriction endonuclease
MHGTLVRSMQVRATVSVRYPVPTTPAAWVLPEGTVPESPVHHDVAHRLTQLLEGWAARQKEPVRVLRNLAVRWLEEHPRTGIDPDVCVLAPPPPDLDACGSLCLWRAGHVAPPLCFEIVSINHPYKDYVALQDRYAALGTRELVVFDPLLAGPRFLGGPVALQVWKRDVSGALERVHFGNGPAYSDVLDAWLLPEGRKLELADDRAGVKRWLTPAERAQADAERAQADTERAQADAERAQADAERAQADAERERARSEDLERRLRELERKANGR